MNTKVYLVHLFGSREIEEVEVHEGNCAFCSAAGHYKKEYDAFDLEGDALHICATLKEEGYQPDKNMHVHEVMYLGESRGLPLYMCRCVHVEYARQLAAMAPN